MRRFNGQVISLTQAEFDALGGRFEEGATYVVDQKVKQIGGSTVSAGGGSARLTPPAAHVEPVPTSETVTVSYGPSADGATANTEYAALGTPTVRFDQSANLTAALRRVELEGVIRADRVEENLGTRLDSILLASTTTPFFGQSANGGVRFATASPNVILVGYPNSTLKARVLVDGRRLPGSDTAGILTGPVATTAGRPNWIKLAFADARPRVISCMMGNIKSIILDDGYYAAPPYSKKASLLEVGDSFLKRVCATGEAAAWGDVGLLAGRAIGLNTVNIGHGGTGWLSTAGNTRPNYRQGLAWLAANAPDYKPDHLLCWGSGNDNSLKDGLQQQVTDTLREALGYWPNLRRVVVTGVYGGYNTDAVAADLSARIKAGVAAVGDSRIDYIPMHTPDTDDPLFFGTGSVAAPANDGNADVYFSSVAQGAADRHPNRGGVVYAAEYLARRLYSSITGTPL